ncbi:MAG: DUF1836 domain-containing protein [Clostridium sp.]|nr:DUF1836 domain-containing protein [Clostridium sp.]MCM1399972.1 DUF1836 domain-containing protein [Clostridium sp.]MCM1460286.1 DUF1836 domain-containing protein [Bacteroides sp.]
MDFGKDNLKKQIREWIKLGYIQPDDIPSIELYMDQVTTFMDQHLEQNKRKDEDKTLTKTMINNYTKNDLLPPPNKKRYSKEHIILLIYIYYLKNVISISDIHVMLKPLIENYYDNPEAPNSLEEIYTNLYNLEKYQYFNVENSVVKAYELTEKAFEKSDDKYLKKMNFLSLLGYDIFMKKKLMEHIIDEMSAEEQDKEEKNKTDKKPKQTEPKEKK